MTMNQDEDRKAMISARVQEHYDYLCGLGYEVVFTALQGSQNYGLDEYSDYYCSDVDTKSIVLPRFDDFVAAKLPVSAVEVLENNEHAEVKDIRIMFDMFMKENLSYIELLYSNYIIINPKYEALIDALFIYRDRVSTFNKNQFVRCIAGMAYEKQKALCHPYPSIIDKIEKYGYDGKQLSHCARLFIFLTMYASGVPIGQCYMVPEIYRVTLMNYKKELDENGNPLKKEDAIERCDEYVERIKILRNKMASGDDEVDVWVRDFLNELKIMILRSWFLEQLDK